jgi:hypothetical protein
VALLYAVPHSEGFPLGSVAFVCGATVGDVFPFWSLSGLYFLQNGPYLSHGRSVVLFSERLDSSPLLLQLAAPRLCGSEYTLLGMIVAKEHRHF